jgi:formylglycine-generating enzyme required for sulfatase activity/serine/threonine protein kinase
MARHDAQPDGSPDPDRSREIDRVIEQVTAARAAGETHDDQTVIAAHPELMPQLGRELEKLRRIEAAWAATTVGSKSPPRTPPSPAELELARALAADLDRPGIEVPGYTVLRELGRGGQAVVFLAFKMNPGRRVALKVMRDGSLADERALARFKLEAEILADLNHPNIVTIFETGLTADGSHYFAMNFIGGCGLDEYMLRRQKTDPDPSRLLRLFHRICSIVHAAHVKQIVHRDLKPGNIRIDERGEPHILDFGLARPGIDREASAHPVSITGEFLGSLPWSSPEQAAGDPKKLDVRTDVYSLGVILYQMLTGGRFPYEVVGNIRDVLNNIVSAEPTPPSKIIAASSAREADAGRKPVTNHPPAVNAAIEKIVLKALAKNPGDRYQNAGELGRAVADYLLGKSASSSHGPIQRKRRPTLWRRVALAAAAAILVGVTLLQTLTPVESPMKPSRLIKGLVLLVTTGAFGGPRPPDHAPPIAGMAVPDAAAQARTEKLVRDVFGNYPAAPLADRPAIAAKMLEQGMASAGDPAARYVLLKDGGDLAASAGDAATALRAAALIGSTYAIDGNELKLALLRRAVAAATAPTLAAADAQEGVACANEAAAAGNYELASRFLVPAEQAARGSKDLNLILAVQSRAADIKWLQQEGVRAKTAQDKLTKTPTDPDANHTLGRYFCLVRGDWEHGLIGLSKGANAAYHTAATADLAKPVASDKQVAAGDLWWDIAEKEVSGTAQRALRRRAGYWYLQAVANPQFAGLSRALVEKRLGQIPPGDAFAEAPAVVPPAVSGNGPEPMTATNWTPLAANGIPPALVIADVGDKEADADYVKFLGGAKGNTAFRDHIVAPIQANSDGVFKGPGPKNIETNFYAFFIRTKAQQTAALSLRTSEYGAVNVYLDGNQLLTHREDNHNKFETKLPLNLAAGDHAIVIRHRNGWAANWIGVQFEGNTLEIPRTVSRESPAPARASTGTSPNAVTNTLGMKLALIPAGEFMMGTPPTEEGRRSEETLHRVTITKPFLLATTAVTQAQWSAVMGSNPSKFRGDSRPVEMVSWHDAVAFCEKLSAKEGKHYRLPTEAEWEYACRAGTQTAYGGANLNEMGWYKDNSDAQTHPVAQKKANAWGLYDMQGNVNQWCSDGYGGPYGGDAIDPKGANGSKTRVVRGGAWKWTSDQLRAAFRGRAAPGGRHDDVGFRLCLDAPQPLGGAATPGPAYVPPAGGNIFTDGPVPAASNDAQAFARQRNALPQAQQLSATFAKLKEINGGGDIRADFKPQGDGTLHVDITNQDALVSITPLYGLRVSRLNLDSCKNLKSLDGVQGMPLTELNLTNCFALEGDLSALKGMRLTKLCLRDCKSLKNINGIQGMPLTELNMWNCFALEGDLSALHGMRLTHIDLGNCPHLESLSGIQGMPLTQLDLTNCSALTGDLSALRGMQLTRLSMWACKHIDSLDGIQGMPLKELTLTDCYALGGDLAALKGMPLTMVNLWQCQKITSLDGLEGAPLKELVLTRPLGKKYAASILQMFPALKTVDMGDQKITDDVMAEIKKRKRAAAPLAPAVPAVAAAVPRPPGAAASRALVFLGNGKSVPFFAKFTGKQVVTAKHAEIAGILASPDTFNNFNILVFEPNSLCWAKPGLDDAMGQRIARFVERGGNLVIFAQVTKVNCDAIEKPFAMSLSYGGGAQGIVSLDPSLAARLKAGGLTDQQLEDVRVIARAKMTADKAVVLARSKYGPVADVMPFGAGRIIFIGGTLNGPISTVENGTDEAFDLALLSYLFDAAALPTGPLGAPAANPGRGLGGSIFGDTGIKK